MKTVLAFGDSLTWGSDPAANSRHPYASLWPTVLEAGLGGAARVVHEGLGGRTTCFDDFSGPCDRNGARVLPMLLSSHMPIDLVVIMLGTNDLKPALCGTAIGAAAGMKRLVQIVRTHPYDKPGFPVPKVLIVAPPLCRAMADGVPVSGRIVAESEAIAPAYRALAAEVGTGFFDAAKVAEASPVDGVHLSAEATEAIGRALVGPVGEMLA